MTVFLYSTLQHRGGSVVIARLTKPRCAPFGASMRSGPLCLGLLSLLELPAHARRKIAELTNAGAVRSIVPCVAASAKGNEHFGRTGTFGTRLVKTAGTAAPGPADLRRNATLCRAPAFVSRLRRRSLYHRTVSINEKSKAIRLTDHKAAVDVGLHAAAVGFLSDHDVPLLGRSDSVDGAVQTVLGANAVGRSDSFGTVRQRFHDSTVVVPDHLDDRDAWGSVHRG
jgi:hypothetical protein